MGLWHRQLSCFHWYRSQVVKVCIALIPCAERLSFVTEQVALHTNGTIGVLKGDRATIEPMEFNHAHFFLKRHSKQKAINTFE
jgi:hypothetical protein